MDLFTLNDQTTYWICPITTKTWEEYAKYLENQNSCYISSFISFVVKSGDIIIIYRKGSKNGFISILQTKGDVIKNNSNKLKIFKDKNYNKHCIGIELYTILEKPRQTKNIESVFDGDYECKNKASFTKKFLNGDLQLKNINSKLGLKLINKLIEPNPDIEEEKKILEKKQKQKQKQKQKPIFQQIIISDDDNDDDKISVVDMTEDNEISDHQIVNEIDINSIVPVVIILCDEYRNKMLNADYDEDNIFQTIIEHSKSCKLCDITDNDNSLMNIIMELNKNDDKIKKYLEEIDSTYDKYDEMMEAYYFTKKFNRDETLGLNITINFIDDIADNIYNNCIVITATL